MNEQSNIRPYHWGDLDISETLFISGIPHLTRKAIGEWLEYGEPTKAVSKIVERNPHIVEFELSSVVTTVDGKNREVFVYDPVGFMLIAMESEQPKAIEFKVSIAKFVAHFTKKPKLTLKEERIMRTRLTMLGKSMVDETDMVSLKLHWAEAIFLCDTLGLPYPEAHLMKQKWQQMTLMGGYDIVLPNAKKAAGEGE